jgi:hypothetical protein
MYIVTAIIGSFCIAASVILGVTLRPKKLSAAVVTETGPLFYTNGTVNINLVGQLANLLDLVQPSATNFSTFQYADARKIATANTTTNVPELKLFETLTSTVKASTNANANKLSEQNWRLVSITFPTNGANPVFTFLSTGAYRNSKFGGISTNATQDYNMASSADVADNYRGSPGCYLRNELTNDFESGINGVGTETGLLSKFPNSVADCFVRPNDMTNGGYGWQVNVIGGNNPPQPTISAMSAANAINQNLNAQTGNDRIFIPSEFEMGTKAPVGSAGVFNINSAERFFNDFNNMNFSWSRSGISTSIFESCIYKNTDIAPIYSRDFSYNLRAVRPALHLVLPAIPVESTIAAGFAPGSTTGAGAGVVVN